MQASVPKARHMMQYTPEYLDFFGSLLTTAIVNCAKWLQPAWQVSVISQSVSAM